MLIAEIRRKLPSIEDIDADGSDALAQIRGLLRETKEDLLTSDVFGVLKYLPRRPYLESVLATLALRNPASKEFQDALPVIRENVQRMVFQFWPNYPTPVGLADGRTEPDVEIADDRVFLLFEAKLGSAFGDRQLERELAVAAYEASGREFFVVLVTPGIKPPRFRHGTDRLQAADYLEAVAATDVYSVEARKLLLEGRNRVLWISWEAIQQALNEAHEQHRAVGFDQTESVLRAADMLGDFNALMLLRQIRPFTGFAGLRQIVSEDRPVFLKAPSIQAEDKYDLARVVSVAPDPFGWRCPALPTAHASDAFIPLGTCCESWQVSSDTRSFRLFREHTPSSESWCLTSALRRWPLSNGWSGFAVHKSSGKFPRRTSSADKGGGFDLQATTRNRDLPSGKSGFGIKRSEQ